MTEINDMVSILIADDHPIFRTGLMHLISERAEFRIVGGVANGVELIEAALRLQPKILIVDVDMPETDGIEATRRLRSVGNSSEVIFLTMHKNRTILRAMGQLGVRGYVLKDSAMEDIVDCIDTVRRGEFFLSRSLNELVVSDAYDADSEHEGRLNSLSATEIKVLAQIADSRSTREIAEDLFISIRTVETHRYNICTKLGLKGSHSLLRFSLQNRSAILAFLGE